MKSYLLLFVICLGLLLPSRSYGQGPDITTRLSRMMDVISENHIQPKEVDAKFVQQVHLNFLETIDPDALILTSEDVDRMKRCSELLTNAIRLNSARYIDSIYHIWGEARQEAEEVVMAIFKEPIPWNQEVNKEWYESAVSDANFVAMWRGFIRSEVIAGSIELIDGEDLSEDKIKAQSDEVFQALQLDFEEYFSNLDIFKLEFEDDFLNAVAMTYDPHTSYFSASTNKAFEEELSAERELFGITYGRSNKGELIITKVLPGSAAWMSGEVHEGDKLLRIDFGQDKSFSLKGKTTYYLGKLFDEHAEKEIVLTLQSTSEPKRSVVLIKSKVYTDADVIKSAVLKGDKKVGYISLPDFYTDWEEESGLGCANDLAKVVIKLKQENVEGIILDLRDNGGGSLAEAVDLSGIFIDYGPILVVDDGGEKPRTIKDMNRGLIFSGPLVVMVNGYSASASEVVAGVFQDYNRALIVGAPSFGKATGQQILPLAPADVSYDTEEFEAFGYIKVTNAALYRISLETNQSVGVVPDVELPLAGEKDYSREEDYPTVLEHNSIEKKMYFTPKPALDVAQLSAISGDRIENNGTISAWITLETKVEEAIDQFDLYTASIADWIELENELDNFSDQLSVLRSKFDVTFTPESVLFDSEVYCLDPVLNMYNERFLDRLKKDVDLSETYEIMNQLITK